MFIVIDVTKTITAIVVIGLGMIIINTATVVIVTEEIMITTDGVVMPINVITIIIAPCSVRLTATEWQQ